MNSLGALGDLFVATSLLVQRMRYYCCAYLRRVRATSVQSTKSADYQKCTQEHRAEGQADSHWMAAGVMVQRQSCIY